VRGDPRSANGPERRGLEERQRSSGAGHDEQSDPQVRIERYFETCEGVAHRKEGIHEGVGIGGVRSWIHQCRPGGQRWRHLDGFAQLEVSGVSEADRYVEAGRAGQGFGHLQTVRSLGAFGLEPAGGQRQAVGVSLTVRCRQAVRQCQKFQTGNYQTVSQDGWCQGVE
jgi:hypothetical protein